MDDATKIVNETVLTPDELNKLVRAALPDVYLDREVGWDYDGAGDWLLVVRGSQSQDKVLAVVEWQTNEDGSTLYLISPEQFLDNYMMSLDRDKKSEKKWIQYSRKGFTPHYDSLGQCKRALLREPAVQRRIARLTYKAPTAVEAAVDKGIARELIQERITDQLTQDGWTIQKSGFHATGRAYIVGRGPAETTKEAASAVDIAAICAHAAVDKIEAGKRGESASWQVDFTIREGCEEPAPKAAEPVEELAESDVKDFVQSYMGKWRVGRHTWGSGTTTYYVFKGIGDRQPDEHNRENLSHAVLSSWGAQQSADYMNWLEGAFMPSERFDNVEQWRTAATLAGMIKKWHSLLSTGKVQEGYEDALQATVRAAIPAIDDRERISRLSKRLATLGVSGDIRLNYHEIHAMRNNYDVGLVIYLQTYPDEWKRVTMPHFNLIRPILQNAVGQEFKEYSRFPIAGHTAAGGGIMFNQIFTRKGKIPTAPRTQFIYATIGQDAEYRSRPGSRTEAMSPGDLARATDMDAIIRAIITSMAARMKEMGAKGVVYAKKPGPDPMEPGKEMVEIGFHLTHAPAEEWYHGRNFQEEWEKLFDVELDKYPHLPPVSPKAYGQVAMSFAGGEPILVAWIPWSVPGRFFTRKNVNIVLEAMDPGELYAKSLTGTRTGAMIDMQKIADALTQDGFNGTVESSISPAKQGDPVRVDYVIKRPNDLTHKDWHQLARRLYKSFQKTGLNGEGINLRIPGIPYVRHLDTFWFSQNVFLRGNPSQEQQIRLPVGHGKIYAD